MQPILGDVSSDISDMLLAYLLPMPVECLDADCLCLCGATLGKRKKTEREQGYMSLSEVLNPANPRVE